MYVTEDANIEVDLALDDLVAPDELGRSQAAAELARRLAVVWPVAVVLHPREPERAAVVALAGGHLRSWRARRAAGIDPALTELTRSALRAPPSPDELGPPDAPGFPLGPRSTIGPGSPSGLGSPAPPAQPAPPGPPGPLAGERLLRALQGLPVKERAAVMLTGHTDAAAAGRALGVDMPELTRLLQQASARLGERPALELLPELGVPPELGDHVLARAQQVRSRRNRALALPLVAVLALLGVSALNRPARPGADRPDLVSSPPSAGAPAYQVLSPPVGRGFIAWSPSGSMVHDLGWIRLASEAWRTQASLGQIPYGAVYPIWSTRMAGGRVALLQAQTSTGRIMVVQVGDREGLPILDHVDVIPDPAPDVLVVAYEGDFQRRGGRSNAAAALLGSSVRLLASPDMRPASGKGWRLRDPSFISTTPGATWSDLQIGSDGLTSAFRVQSRIASLIDALVAWEPRSSLFLDAASGAVQWTAHEQSYGVQVGTVIPITPAVRVVDPLGHAVGAGSVLLDQLLQMVTLANQQLPVLFSPVTLRATVAAGSSTQPEISDPLSGRGLLGVLTDFQGGRVAVVLQPVVAGAPVQTACAGTRLIPEPLPNIPHSQVVTVPCLDGAGQVVAIAVMAEWGNARLLLRQGSQSVAEFEVGLAEAPAVPGTWAGLLVALPKGESASGLTFTGTALGRAGVLGEMTLVAAAG